MNKAGHEIAYALRITPDEDGRFDVEVPDFAWLCNVRRKLG
jgi:hypothetical protein